MTATPPVLAGYTYIRPLGSGGFADVFLYEQDMPRRVTAVKVLHNDAIDPEVLRTFHAEADVSARLSGHPSIVTIYQAGISADGRPYFAMEYCPDTMSARYKSGPLGLPEVLDTGVRIAGAIETAHRAGLLHRDIKPSNILITPLGAPVLADFGIASGLAADEAEARAFAMSVPWSAPEVLLGETTGSVASEVFSLGATLYTLLAGRSPFEVDDRSKNTRDQLSARIRRAVYPALPRHDLPASVDHILSTAMHRQQSRRYASMGEFAERLRRAQSEIGVVPTVLEVAASEWVGAAPVRFNDAAPRGPVVTTVDKNSRRAARARRQFESAGTDRDGLPLAPASSGSLRTGMIGAAIGAGCVAALVGALLVSGVL